MILTPYARTYGVLPAIVGRDVNARAARKGSVQHCTCCFVDDDALANATGNAICAGAWRETPLASVDMGVTLGGGDCSSLQSFGSNAVLFRAESTHDFCGDGMVATDRCETTRMPRQCNDILEDGGNANTLLCGEGGDAIRTGDSRDSATDALSRTSALTNIKLAHLWGAIDLMDDNVTDGGASDDTLLGAGGSHVIHGGDDHDLLQGPRGKDVRFGPASDDALDGDGVAAGGRLDTTLAPQQGNDMLVGGGGDDDEDEMYGRYGDDQPWADHTDARFSQVVDHRSYRLDSVVEDNALFGRPRAGTLSRACVMRSTLPVLALCLLAVASSARADWAVLGAAYECKAGKSFELRATVDTSSPNDPGTVRPQPGFTALKQDEPSRLTCVAGQNKVEAVISVWSPRNTGMCAGSGGVSIESLLVNGKPILRMDEAFNMSCPSGSAVVSVRVQGSSVRVCRGEWDWGKGYRRVKCDVADA